jgi:hypothetical protein
MLGVIGREAETEREKVRPGGRGFERRRKNVWAEVVTS